MTNSPFTSDHIRTIANWAEALELIEQQAAMYNLYHKMTVTKSATDEEITSYAMGAIQVIRDTEKDREMFYRTMNAWGI